MVVKKMEIFDKFDNDKNIFISAFINFYGEKNSEYIIDRIKNANTIWHDSKSIEDNSDIFSHIITDMSKDRLEYFLSKRKSEAFLQSSYIDEFNLLVLPQDYNISHIIHEINHMIASHVISLSPYAVINGISFSMERGDEVILENDSMNEVINQLMTFDIINELKRLGINVVYTPSWQDNAFPLIMPFYNRFKDSLKELYISGDFQAFVNQFDKERFQDFLQFIFMKLFKIKRKLRQNEQITVIKEEIEKVENYIDDMVLEPSIGAKK